MRGLLTILLTLALVRSIGATVVAPMDLEELARDARTIARGRVVAVEARWTDGRRTIETIVTLEPEAILKGPRAGLVRFRVPGGLLGRFRNVVVGAPQFEPGQQVMVFLGATGPMIPYVLGLNQGVYRIERTDAGAWTVMPPPILPSAGRLVRGAPERLPAPLDDFDRRVRSLVENGR